MVFVEETDGVRGIFVRMGGVPNVWQKESNGFDEDFIHGGWSGA